MKVARIYIPVSTDEQGLTRQTDITGFMSRMFRLADDFNQDISSCDVSSVANMDRMFHLALNFANQDLSGWNVSNVVTHMEFLVGSGGHNIEPNWP